MRVIYLFIFSMIATYTSYSQFAPAAGKDGSTAIHKDSSVFVDWADNVEIHRGYMDISNKSLGYVDYGEENYAFGKADGKVVSLGDSGIAIIYLANPVINGDSWDFAIFENGFSDEFLELAFVEVSSDGEHYFRFSGISLTDTTEQIKTFGTLDTRKLHNFAGKYRVNYGTPFDLDSLSDDAFLNKDNIQYIKIIDVVGSINAEFASYDSKGNKVNDPYPTAFNTGGFDLDAVGIIHQKEYNKTKESELIDIAIYPNPFCSYINIDPNGNQITGIEVMDIYGKKVFEQYNPGRITYDLSKLSAGIYFIKINFANNNVIIRRIIKF